MLEVEGGELPTWLWCIPRIDVVGIAKKQMWT